MRIPAMLPWRPVAEKASGGIGASTSQLMTDCDLAARFGLCSPRQAALGILLRPTLDYRRARRGQPPAAGAW